MNNALRSRSPLSGGRTSDQNRRLHTLLSQLCIPIEEKAGLALQYSGGRTSSTSSLSGFECENLLDDLQAMWNRKTAKTRNAIIHYLCLLGYTTSAGTPDYTRINTYIRDIGARNPKAKILGALNLKELNECCTQVKARYEHEMKRISSPKAEAKLPYKDN